MKLTGLSNKFKKMVCAEMNRRISPLMKDDRNRMATMLDPRYRPLKKLMSLIDVDEQEKKLIKEVGSVKSDKVVKSRQKMGVLRSIFDGSDDDEEESNGVESELIHFNRLATSERAAWDSDPLDFWRRHAGNFPLLIPHVKKFYALRPTSIDVERLFSSVTSIYKDRSRSNLHANRSRKMIFASCATTLQDRRNGEGAIMWSENEDSDMDEEDSEKEEEDDMGDCSESDDDDDDMEEEMEEEMEGVEEEEDDDEEEDTAPGPF